MSYNFVDPLNEEIKKVTRFNKKEIFFIVRMVPTHFLVTARLFKLCYEILLASLLLMRLNTFYHLFPNVKNGLLEKDLYEMMKVLKHVHSEDFDKS